MNKINRKLEYALMALKHMSSKRPGQLTTAKEVSDSYSCPFDATARVMQRMAQSGLLKAELGAQGGYQITKDLAKISVYDIIKVVLGPLGISKCLIEGRSCEISESCNITSPINKLNGRLMDFYKQVSLLELLENKSGSSDSRPSSSEHKSSIGESRSNSSENQTSSTEPEPNNSLEKITSQMVEPSISLSMRGE